MSDERDLYRERATNNADSIRYTYKQHFAVANFYRALLKVLDFVTFGAAALLVANSFWEVVPSRYIIVPPLVIAGITGYRRGSSLSDRVERFRQSAREYHALFDRYRDFLTITLETEELNVVREEFEELSERRRELNRSTPDANGLWYRYLKWKGENKLNEEVKTSAETKEAFSADD